MKPSVNLLLKEKPTKLLLELLEKPGTITNIERRVDMSWKGVVDLLRGFEKWGIVKSRKVGRSRLYELTEEGRKIAEKIKKLEKMMEGRKDEDNQ